MIASAVYVLCALTSLACALLLLRGYRRSGTRLLLWSGLCFIGFFINNVLLVLDLVVLPQYDLLLLRDASSLAGIGALLVGLLWESHD